MNTKLRTVILLLALACGFTASAGEYKYNLTLGANAVESEDAYRWGGEIALSIQRGNWEFGVRQVISAVDLYDVTETTTTSTSTSTTTTTKPNIPKGKAYGWYKNGVKTHTTTTSTSTTTTTIDESREWLGDTAAFLNYHVPITCRLSAVIGGNVGAGYASGVGPDYHAGPEAGLRLRLDRHLFLFGRAQYDFNIAGREAPDVWRFASGLGFKF